MSGGVGYERCLAFINCQMQGPKTFRPCDGPGGWRAVTFSRQMGCDGSAVAEKLRGKLQAATPKDDRPWTVFDRNLLEQVLADHHLPQRLASHMPEDRVSGIKDAVEEFFGLHPPTWIMARQTTGTILRLAELGRVILVGRGANVITAGLDRVFHVRLVGSLDKRVARVQAEQGLTHQKAQELVRRIDGGRARYVRRYFNKDIDDPLLYTLIVNSDSMPAEATADVICHAMRCMCQSADG